MNPDCCTFIYLYVFGLVWGIGAGFQIAYGNILSSQSLLLFSGVFLNLALHLSVSIVCKGDNDP